MEGAALTMMVQPFGRDIVGCVAAEEGEAAWMTVRERPTARDIGIRLMVVQSLPAVWGRETHWGDF